MAPQNDQPSDPQKPQDQPVASPPGQNNFQPAQPVVNTPSTLYTPIDPDGEPPVVSTVDNSPSASPMVLPTPSSAPPAPIQKKSHKKFAVIGVIVVLLLLLVGSASAFAFWYNKPENVVADAFRQALIADSATAKGQLLTTGTDGNDMNIKLTYDFASNTAGDTRFNSDFGLSSGDGEFKLKSSVVTSKNTLYVKAENVQELFEKTVGGFGASPAELSVYDRLIAMIDNKWVVITQADIRELTGEDTFTDEKSTCAENALKDFRNNKRMQDEVAKVYADNTFVVIAKNLGTEMVNGRSSNGYELTVDEAKAKSFADAIVNTEIVKKVDTCSDGELTKTIKESEDEATSSEDKSEAKVVLWVDMWSHKPTKVSISGQDDTSRSTFDSLIDLGNNPVIDIPKADTTVDDIKDEIEQIQGELSSSVNSDFDTGLDDSVLGIMTRR